MASYAEAKGTGICDATDNLENCTADQLEGNPSKYSPLRYFSHHVLLLQSWESKTNVYLTVLAFVRQLIQFDSTVCTPRKLRVFFSALRDRLCIRKPTHFFGN